MQLITSIDRLHLSSRAREAALTLTGILLLFASAQITIPLQPIPITLQTVAVMLIGLTFAMRPALNAVALYLTIGARGAPVFGDWSGGIIKIFGPSGGYLIGFFAAVLAMTTFRKFISASSFWMTIVNCTFGTAVVFVCGIAWLSRFVGIQEAFQLGLFPFIIPGALKALILCASLHYIRSAKNFS